MYRKNALKAQCVETICYNMTTVNQLNKKSVNYDKS